MRLESISAQKQSLPNSTNQRIAAENKTVEQNNEFNYFQDGTPKQIKTAVDRLNDFVEPLNTNLKFELHGELNEYYVTIINPDTNEVIREIPSKKILDMYAAMGEYMGFLIDKKI